VAHQGIYIAAVVIAVVMGWTSRAAATESTAAVAGQPSLMAPDARVRGLTPRVAAILTDAAAQSETFRGLLARIGITDGIVYVTEDHCGEGLRACLLHTVTIAGPSRVLWILVDPRNSDRDLMESIGHELQHAVEVLSDRSVRSNPAILMLYRQRCQLCGGLRGPFETIAAIDAGNAVRAELEESAAAERRE
jgi:hypothetical protein